MKEVLYRERDGVYSQDLDFYIDRRVISYNLHKGPHWHDYCEVEFCLSGRGDHLLNNGCEAIGPGSVYILTPMDFHKVVVGENEPLELYHISFGSFVLSSGLMQRIAQVREQVGRGLSACLSGFEMDSMRADFEQLLREYEDRSPDGEMMMRACLERLCIRILRLMGSNGKTAPLQPPVNENLAIASAVQYINYNYRSSVTLGETARMVQLSSNYFGELFRKQMGVSFGEYLRFRRLECAHHLLAETDLNISEIARESGFKSMSHFSDTFRRRYGLTPTEFRSRERKESEDKR